MEIKPVDKGSVAEVIEILGRSALEGSRLLGQGIRWLIIKDRYILPTSRGASTKTPQIHKSPLVNDFPYSSRTGRCCEEQPISLPFLLTKQVCAYLLSCVQFFLCDSMDCSPLGSSVHGILQARALEWVAMPSSRGSSQPRDQTKVSHIAGGFFTVRATSKTLQDRTSTDNQFRHINRKILQRGQWTEWYFSRWILNPAILTSTKINKLKFY